MQHPSIKNISNVAYTNFMFHGAVAVQSVLRGVLQVGSFFEGKFRDMAADYRREVFGRAMRWYRRKYFVLFLVTQKYLYSRRYANEVDECFTGVLCCDAVFDVEDVTRHIVKFL